MDEHVRNVGNQPQPMLAQIQQVATANGMEVASLDEGFTIWRRGLLTGLQGRWLTEDTFFVYLSCRVTSWEMPGERTDANDVFSLLLAAYLRCLPACFSCVLWDVSNPAVEVPATEVYSRYLTLAQPGRSIFRSDKSSLAELGQLCADIRAFEMLFPHAFGWEHGDSQSYNESEDVQEWAQQVATVLEEKLDKRVQYNSRGSPDWLYYRSIRRNVTVVWSPPTVLALQLLFCKRAPGEIVRGINRYLFVTDRVRSAIPLRAEQWAYKVLRKLNGEESQYSVIPLENRVIVAGGEHVLAISRDCSEQQFREERARIERRHRREARILFRPSRFIWSERIDDDAFELLIYDLLAREPGVTRVRKAGRSRDADRGKDLLVEWITPPAPGVVVPENSSPAIARKVLVQVKVSARSVGKSDVVDIRDTLDAHEATGFFLAVSSQITNDLTDHLDRMRSEGKYWTDWWNRTEIEERLAGNADVLARYAQIVTRVDE